MPGCWKGNERTGVEGSAESRARAGKKVSPPSHCPAPWPGLGHLWGGTQSSPELTLVWEWPGVPHLSLQHLYPPEPGTNLNKGPLSYSTRKDLLPPKTHLQVSQRLTPTPPGGLSPVSRFSVEIHARHTGTALYTTHIKTMSAHPFCPCKDRDASGGGGSRASPAPALSRCRSPRP